MPSFEDGFFMSGSAVGETHAAERRVSCSLAMLDQFSWWHSEIAFASGNACFVKVPNGRTGVSILTRQNVCFPSTFAISHSPELPVSNVQDLMGMELL